MTLESDRGKTSAVAALVTALSGVLYFCTAARDIVVGDTPELITAAATLGVAHPPGYPLFTLLGHFFSLLPVGPVPFRVNLLSVISDALAVGVIFLIAFHLSKSRLASAIAALALAVSPVFWTWSLSAEVFALNNLLAATFIYLLVRWHEEPGRAGFLFAASFVFGLGLTNHQTMVLLAPAIAFILWKHRTIWWGHRPVVDRCALAFAAGLLPYAYIPWAASHHPFMNWGDASSLTGLLNLIARRNYGSGSLVSTVAYRGGSVLDRIAHLVVSLSPLMGILATLGLIRAWRSQQWYFWFTLLAFGFVGPFFVALTNLNLATAPSALYVLERFFILPQVIIAPLAALGIMAISRFITSKAPSLRMSPTPWIAAACVIVILVSVFANYRAIDQSDNHIARHFGEDALTSVDPGAILLAGGDSIVLPLAYLLETEHVRPDVTLVVVPLMPTDWYLRELRQRHPDLKIPFSHYDPQSDNLKMFIDANQGRPITLAGTLPGNDHRLDESYRMRQRGLISVVEPGDEKELTLLEAARDNEEQVARFTFPERSRIKAKTFEEELVSVYAVSVAQLGRTYERMDRKAEALHWYGRAYALDPDLPKLREALARVKP